MASDRLIYLPLGGAGEIGMNCYVYGYGPKNKERYILVDLGVTFPDMDSTPGVDLIFPDVAWIEERADRLDAIFVTHAHEDHVGAVAHLFTRLNAPVYARAFTAHIAGLKFDEHGLDRNEIKTVSAYPETVQAGPFKVAFMPISHSIPESSALIIDTPAGRVVHSGDFKIDETPGVGEAFDRVAWAEMAKSGVKALVCDSTNVFSPKPGQSEATVGPEIEALIKSATGMVVATTFASNIARVKTLAEAGQRAGRSVVLLGRAMKRMIGAGVEVGILTDFPNTIAPEDAKRIRVVRDAIGEDVRLMVDANQSLTVAEATVRGRAFEDMGVYWWEEPIPADDVDGYAELAGALDIPVATGENLYTLQDFARFMKRDAVDIIQPDLRRAGGPTALLRIGALAEGFRRPYASHGGGPVQLNVMACLPNALYLETGLIGAGSKLVLEDGCALLPRGPGFSWE